MNKILILNTTLNKGGAARVAKDIFENLNKDFDIYFAYGRGKKDINEKTFYFGNKIEILVHVLLVRFLGLEGYGGYFSTKKLIRFIEKNNFNLINLHNLHGYYVNFFTLFNYLGKKGIPIVYTLHDEWPMTWLPAHSLGCTHCKTGIGKCINLYSYPKNYFPIFRKLMLESKKKMFSRKMNLHIICPSIWLQNNISNSFLNFYNIGKINPGIDTNLFKPSTEKNELRKKYNLPTNKKIILFSASNLNDESKGIKYILEISKKLMNEEYLFLGLGNGELAKQDNIRLFGYVYNKNILADLYSLSDLFCFTSKAETFLLSAAEAMSCGTPVVGFDLPVVRELVNNKVGILTESNSVSLSETINFLLSNENTIKKMGENGRKMIEEKYSKEIFYTKYKDLFVSKIK